jgi:hypothetical protein
MIKNFYNNSIEQIEFKNYEINNNTINLQLELIDEIALIAKESNLKFILSGMWGFIFNYKKIYRTPSDVDILIEEKDLKNWFDLLQNECDFLYMDDPVVFIKEFLNGNRRLQPLYHKRFNEKLELINIKNIEQEYKFFPIQDMKFNNYTLRVKDSLKVKSTYVGRQKDKDDIEFYFGNAS